MSEQTSNPPRRRYRRRVAVAALGVALLGTTALATSAEADHLNAGDPRAVAFHGSISHCPSGTTQLLYAPNGGNATGGGVTATITNVTNVPTPGGQYLQLDFVTGLNGAVVTAYVKGANNYNAYTFTVAGTITGLHSPLKGSNIPAVSHYLICQVEAPPPPPQFDTPPNIRLGYADDSHSGGGTPTSFKPSPWKGDPGVVYLGCDGAFECGGAQTGKFDGGAILIENVDTDTSLELVAASVDIGPCNFVPWGEYLPASAGPNGKFVLTQTGVQGPQMPQPCAAGIEEKYWPETNFDTSERPGDTRFNPTFYDCNPAERLTPVITLTFEDGPDGPDGDVTLTINDTTRILNTGGVDRYACQGLDEAQPWSDPIFYTVP